MPALVSTHQPQTQTWTFFEGDWHEGNIAIMGPRTHGAWMASTVFDGARVFEGTAPDLDQHCARINRSAAQFGLEPVTSEETWLGLAREGATRFAPDAPLYVRPMYWADAGLGGGVQFDPASTRWCLCLYEAAMPTPTGIAVTLSPFRRPTSDSAPVEAKAGCLYPNGARALREAQSRGFANALVCDALGDVAELANANIFMVKDGVVFTPAANGSFLDGVTRRRVIGLLRADGMAVVEKTLRHADFRDADEIFSSGNFNKLAPVVRIEDRALEVGPIYARARGLYWSFAHETRSAI